MRMILELAWQRPPESLHGSPIAPPLAADEAHLWRVFLDQAAADPDHPPEALRALLSADEQARADRYRIARVRDQYVIGRGVLRTLLGRYLNLPPAAIRFDYGPRGKPMLGGPLADHPLRFNLSHSENVLALAFASGRAIGVDVEYIRPIAEMPTIVADSFAPAEVAIFRALPDSAQLTAFLDAWTRKEAVLKALGSGLAIPLRDVQVSFAPGEPARIVRLDIQGIADRAGHGHDSGDWRLFGLRPAEGYAGALAIWEARGAQTRLLGWQWA